MKKFFAAIKDLVFGVIVYRVYSGEELMYEGRSSRISSRLYLYLLKCPEHAGKIRMQMVERTTGSTVDVRSKQSIKS